VKPSALSRAADLAISVHLITDAEIDDFVDDARGELGCEEGAGRGSSGPDVDQIGALRDFRLQALSNTKLSLDREVAGKRHLADMRRLTVNVRSVP
jgi:hypothetical protein